MVVGTVREWHEDEGWGVIDSPETTTGCWAHFSSVLVDGYRKLTSGQSVCLEWEAASQDGYSYRAIRVWIDGDEDGRASDQAPNTAYRSQLHLPEDERHSSA